MVPYKDDMSLAECLKEAMDAKAIATITDLAVQLHVSQPTVSRWLTGAPPDDEKADEIAAFLGVDADDVLRRIQRARIARRKERRQQQGQSTGEDFDEAMEVFFRSRAPFVSDETLANIKRQVARDRKRQQG